MATYRQFMGTSGSVLVEVLQTGGTPVSAGDLPELLTPITELATAMGSQLARIPQQGRPEEVELKFGVIGLDNGRVAITLDQSANVHVRMQWGAPQSTGLPMPDQLPPS